MSSASEPELEWWGPGTVPAAGSIVWCHFPEDISPTKPGPKARPALVLKARYVDNPPSDRFYVLVAYGTSNMKFGRRKNDFYVANSVVLDILRLPQATRFDLDNLVWLPWATAFFCPRDTTKKFTTPTVSVLSEDMLQVLRWTMARREQQGLNSAYHGARTVEPPHAEPSGES